MSDKIIPFPLPLAVNPPVRVPVEDLTRDQAIKRIRDALKLRSGKPWSVTGGTGTAWGWIRIDAPPARRTRRVRAKVTPRHAATTSRPPSCWPTTCGRPT